MAIKITKPGQTVFHGFCDRCGCEFTYEIIDLKLSAIGNKVNCPTCGKDYHHPSMVQDPAIPGGIGRLQDLTWPPAEPIPCTPDMTKTDPCAGCAWRENLLRDGLYVGDTPCTWCNKNKFNTITGMADNISVKDYTTPCINQLDVNLNTSTSNNTKYTTVYGCTDGVDCKEDITQGTVMQTILGCCSNATSSSCNCGDTEGHNSCSGEHKCGSKKNCKGKH